jgi:hypothetical protein
MMGGRGKREWSKISRRGESSKNGFLSKFKSLNLRGWEVEK